MNLITFTLPIPSEVVDRLPLPFHCCKGDIRSIPVANDDPHFEFANFQPPAIDDGPRGGGHGL